ncbi:hypothetical protein [Streptomyces sp. NPDC058371]|uniref:hypothetical protein n=1 Tax=Streptomyces sp. NPDC058371 TaxID=3346463 RepID=UPI00366104D6
MHICERNSLPDGEELTPRQAADPRTSLLAFRAAVRRARHSPTPSTLGALRRAVLPLSEGQPSSLIDERRMPVLRLLELAEESPLFPRIDLMMSTVVDLTRLMPSWMPPYAAEAMANVMRLLAVCHEHQTDMEEHPLNPWSRAAEAGTRLVGIILRRTDPRPADALMLRTAEEFARWMKAAVAHAAVATAAQFAELVAREYGMFPIGPRIGRMNGGAVEWSRLIGATRYDFRLFEAGWIEAFPNGRVDVRRSGSSEDFRTFPLTARTRRKVTDRFTASL